MINYQPDVYNFGDNKLPRVDIRGKRHYQLDNGMLLPSVTTVLSHRPKQAVIDWRKRVGEEAADRISSQATFRGDQVHKMAENYIVEQSTDYREFIPMYVEMFQWVKKEIDQNLNVVYGSETALYSETLAVAGSADILGQWKGEDAIVDFKTSTKAKRRDWIYDYFMQEAMYGFMAFERSSAGGKAFFPKKIVTLVATEETRTCEVFVERSAPWLDKAIEIVQEYQKAVANEPLTLA